MSRSSKMSLNLAGKKLGSLGLFCFRV
jgi:hypothetical protein